MESTAPTSKLTSSKMLPIVASLIPTETVSSRVLIHWIVPTLNAKYSGLLIICGTTKADLCIHPRGRLKFRTGRILEGMNIENFGFASPIGFGKGQVRELRSNSGAPSSCNNAYGEADRVRCCSNRKGIFTHLYQTSTGQTDTYLF